MVVAHPWEQWHTGDVGQRRGRDAGRGHPCQEGVLQQPDGVGPIPGRPVACKVSEFRVRLEHKWQTCSNGFWIQSTCIDNSHIN